MNAASQLSSMPLSEKDAARLEIVPEINRLPVQNLQQPHRLISAKISIRHGVRFKSSVSRGQFQKNRRALYIYSLAARPSWA